MKKSELKQLIKEVLSDDNSYKQKVIKFLDYPWQEDAEIEVVTWIDQYRNNILHSPKQQTQEYLKQVDKSLTGSFLQRVSDEFMFQLGELISN